jgi:hypothetical protein
MIIIGLAITPLYGVIIGVPKPENIDLNQSAGNVRCWSSLQLTYSCPNNSSGIYWYRMVILWIFSHTTVRYDVRFINRSLTVAAAIESRL